MPPQQRTLHIRLQRHGLGIAQVSRVRAPPVEPDEEGLASRPQRRRSIPHEGRQNSSSTSNHFKGSDRSEERALLCREIPPGARRNWEKKNCPAPLHCNGYSNLARKVEGLQVRVRHELTPTPVIRVLVSAASPAQVCICESRRRLVVGSPPAAPVVSPPIVVPRLCGRAGSRVGWGAAAERGGGDEQAARGSKGARAPNHWYVPGPPLPSSDAPLGSRSSPYCMAWSTCCSTVSSCGGGRRGGGRAWLQQQQSRAAAWEGRKGQPPLTDSSSVMSSGTKPTMS